MKKRAKQMERNCQYHIKIERTKKSNTYWRCLDDATARIVVGDRTLHVCKEHIEAGLSQLRQLD